MSLEVAPEIENTVREYADAEGISINDLLARHFPPQTVRRDPVTHVRKLLAEWQQQDHTPVAQPMPDDDTVTPSEALFRKWDAEDAQMSEAEWHVQNEMWERFQQDINAERIATGMRLIF